VGEGGWLPKPVPETSIPSGSDAGEKKVTDVIVGLAFAALDHSTSARIAITSEPAARRPLLARVDRLAETELTQSPRVTIGDHRPQPCKA
jgi:hypothetical protein